MELKVTIPLTPQKLIVTAGDSSLEVDLARFYFGDGKWVVNIQGDDVFR